MQQIYMILAIFSFVGCALAATGMAIEYDYLPLDRLLSEHKPEWGGIAVLAVFGLWCKHKS